MIISDEQVQRVVECLQNQAGYESRAVEAAGVCEAADIVRSTVRAIQLMPDVRKERVDAARALLDGDLPEAEDVARKLIGRVLSDSLR